MLDTKVIKTGPLFRGIAYRLAQEMTDKCRDELAAFAKERVDANLVGSLRNPTGYYQSNIQNIMRGPDRVINDNNVVYGPWLEGVGSRNKTTRFKGYASFRRAKQAVVSEIAKKVQPIVNLYAGRLNGGK